MLLVAILAVALLLAGGWWWLYRLSLPRISGTRRAQGLEKPVEILRDRYGVPHIFASTLADAFFAQGYVHAQDRLWQMELNRRVGAGRLSELFGPMALEADRFLRRLGLRRAAEAEVARLEPEERAVLEAYAAGVNAAMAAMGPRRPLEMRLMGLRPAPWEVPDSLTFAKVMSLNLCTNFEAELFRARVIEKVGHQKAALCALGYPAGHPLVVPPGASSAGTAAELAQLYAAAKEYLPLAPMGASNNWVVSGRRTQSGMPLLANDPHLPLQVPSIWYEVHLVAPGLDVYGVSLAATPGVALGHNRKVAWGFTNSGADVQDLYLERFHPERPGEYEHRGEWLKAKRVREVIGVKGQPDQPEEVLLTLHGPVMAGGPGRQGPALALRWAALDPSHPVAALLEMNRAQSAAEFRNALRKWHTPSQNVVFADVSGEIGFVMAGAVPIRARGSGFSPVPGWTGEYEWTGFVPFDELPQLMNPQSGYLVTANNRVVDPSYPHHITLDFLNGFRARRIEQLLTQKPVLNAADFAQIQMDVFCAPGKAFAAHCQKLQPSGALERRALEKLRAWDGQASPASAGAAVYEAMIVAAVRKVFTPALGRELVDEMMGKSVENPLSPMSMMLGRYTGAFLEALDRRDPALLEISGASSWEAILSEALADAVTELKKRLGEEVESWSWGRIHILQLRHPLGAKKPLNLIFNGPSVPIGGDTDTPLQTAVLPHLAFGAEGWAPSWRQIADLADLSRSVSVHTTGQSGHPGSPHYMDQFPLWYRGEHHPHWLDRSEIEQHLEARLKLEP